eukprot:gene5560-8930_t
MKQRQQLLAGNVVYDGSVGLGVYHENDLSPEHIVGAHIAFTQDCLRSKTTTSMASKSPQIVTLYASTHDLLLVDENDDSDILRLPIITVTATHAVDNRLYIVSPACSPVDNSEIGITPDKGANGNSLQHLLYCYSLTFRNVRLPTRLERCIVKYHSKARGNAGVAQTSSFKMLQLFRKSKNSKSLQRRRSSIVPGTRAELSPWDDDAAIRRLEALALSPSALVSKRCISPEPTDQRRVWSKRLHMSLPSLILPWNRSPQKSSAHLQKNSPSSMEAPVPAQPSTASGHRHEFWTNDRTSDDGDDDVDDDDNDSSKCEPLYDVLTLAGLVVSDDEDEDGDEDPSETCTSSSSLNNSNDMKLQPARYSLPVSTSTVAIAAEPRLIHSSKKKNAPDTLITTPPEQHNMNISLPSSNWPFQKCTSRGAELSFASLMGTVSSTCSSTMSSTTPSRYASIDCLHLLGLSSAGDENVDKSVCSTLGSSKERDDAMTSLDISCKRNEKDYSPVAKITGHHTEADDSLLDANVISMMTPKSRCPPSTHQAVSATSGKKLKANPLRQHSVTPDQKFTLKQGMVLDCTTSITDKSHMDDMSGFC